MRQDILRRFVLWLLAAVSGALAFAVVLRLVVHVLADAATALILSPGGLVLLVFVWRWLSVSEARTKDKKK